MKKKSLFVFILLMIISLNLFSQSIAVGNLEFSLAVCSDSVVRVWGNNQRGQLADSTLPVTASPIAVNSISNIRAIAAGSLHALALKNDGTVWAWGGNSYGQLGDGTVNTTGCFCKTPPVQVSGITGIIAISAGSGHSLALKNDGTVWAWGRNNGGQLGDSTTINKYTPVQVKGLTGIVAIACGQWHSLALKSDGTVWGWGLNTYGELGDSTTTQHISPVQSKLTNIIAIAAGAGSSHSLALKNDSTVWAWGANTYGQLGDGSVTTTGCNCKLLPVQASSLTGIIAIAAGAWHSLAVKNDGTAWAWGYNNYGELGDGTTTTTGCNCNPSPVKVITLTNIIDIAGCQTHSLALKSDSTLWAWGENGAGELGDGTFSTTGCQCKPTPVQVIGGVCPNTTAVNEIAEQENSILYPNPTSGVFTVSGLRSAVSGLEIYNMYGERVYQTAVNSKQQTVNLSSQPQGIYFVQGKTTGGTLTRKIAVQR